MDENAPLASIGIDIGKEVFRVVGVSTDSRNAFRRKIKRLALAETFRALPPCVAGMKACPSAHFVSLVLIYAVDQSLTARVTSRRSSVLPCLFARLGRIRSASGTRLAMNVGLSCLYALDRDGRCHAR
jgi:hypothetical protein